MFTDFEYSDSVSICYSNVGLAGSTHPTMGEPILTFIFHWDVLNVYMLYAIVNEWSVFQAPVSPELLLILVVYASKICHQTMVL